MAAVGGLPAVAITLIINNITQLTLQAPQGHCERCWESNLGPLARQANFVNLNFETLSRQQNKLTELFSFKKDAVSGTLTTLVEIFEIKNF